MNMDSIETERSPIIDWPTKKWRTDYSSLLKCWSAIKTSELIKEMAYKELKQFRASDKAIHRLKSFLERNQYKSSYEQSIGLWTKAIDQFINQRNYFAAAECLENLAEVELKYGKGDKKIGSIHKFVRASTYYRRSDNYKRSIVALKRAITIAEFTQKNEFNFIINSYEECSNLYESLKLHHLAKINRKASRFFGKEEGLIKAKKQASEHSMASTPSTIPIDSEDEHSQDFEESNDQNTSYESESDSSDSDISSTVRPSFDTNSKKKELKHVSVKSEANSSPCTPATNYVCSCKRSSHTIRKYKDLKSKHLLLQNLEIITNRNRVISTSETTDSEDSDDTILYKPPKKLAKFVPPSSSRKQKLVNCCNSISETIPNLKTEQKTTRKRKTKPKENSEELPEKRLIKLQKLNLNHSFIVDQRMPLKKLFCTVCDESILCYRWSIVTDHLKSQRHREYSVNASYRESTFEQLSTTIDNNLSYHSVLLSGENIEPNVPLDQLEQNYQQIASSEDNCELVRIDSQEISQQDPTVNERYSSLKPVELEQSAEEESLTTDYHKSYHSLDTPPFLLKTPEPRIPSPLSEGL